MARSAKARAEKPAADQEQTVQHYCALPPVAPPVYDEVVTGRASKRSIGLASCGQRHHDHLPSVQQWRPGG